MISSALRRICFVSATMPNGPTANPRTHGTVLPCAIKHRCDYSHVTGHCRGQVAIAVGHRMRRRLLSVRRACATDLQLNDGHHHFSEEKFLGGRRIGCPKSACSNPIVSSSQLRAPLVVAWPD